MDIGREKQSQHEGEKRANASSLNNRKDCIIPKRPFSEAVFATYIFICCLICTILA